MYDNFHIESRLEDLDVCAAHWLIFFFIRRKNSNHWLLIRILISFILWCIRRIRAGLKVKWMESERARI
jgi:hypothetical protein